MTHVHLSENEIPGAKLVKEIEKLTKPEAIHLIPKWPPPGKSWGELHKNEVMRAKCAFVL